MKSSDLIIPNWPAPTNVKALQTTRAGGISLAPYDSLNMGLHVQDNPMHVAHNRQLLSQLLPSEPAWLKQVHGINVLNLDEIVLVNTDCLSDADASYTSRKNVVCVTMTADCLPILLCDSAGTTVASIHAGWRSLCDGVIEATVKQMLVKSNQLMAWLGPAIGPSAFEVGTEVRAQFIAKNAQAELAFKKYGENQEQDKWLADIYKIATQRLNNLAVTQIYGGGINQDFCTFSQKEQFFSFRRDEQTGRMATLVWLE